MVGKPGHITSTRASNISAEGRVPASVPVATGSTAHAEIFSRPAILRACNAIKFVNFPCQNRSTTAIEYTQCTLESSSSKRAKARAGAAGVILDTHLERRPSSFGLLGSEITTATDAVGHGKILVPYDAARRPGRRVRSSASTSRLAGNVCTSGMTETCSTRGPLAPQRRCYRQSCLSPSKLDPASRI